VIARTPAAQRRHVGLDPGFVDEDKAGGSITIMDPSPAPACHLSRTAATVLRLIFAGFTIQLLQIVGPPFCRPHFAYLGVLEDVA
jgi:hypothetical protein